MLDGSPFGQIPYPRVFAQYFIGTQTGAGKMYPWLHQKAIEELFGNVSDTTDATQCQHMSLTRSTFAGGQRFCSYLWSGDSISRPDVMLQQITAGVSVAASGMSSWTLDIGGFTGLNVEDPVVSSYRRWYSLTSCSWSLASRIIRPLVRNGNILAICASNSVPKSYQSLTSSKMRAHG